MFKSAYSKFPALLLALLACLVTVYQPVLVLAAVSQSTESESKSKSSSENESETERLLEAQEFCQQTYSSRRLRLGQNHNLLLTPTKLNYPKEPPVLSEFYALPQSVYLCSPPTLRAPPV